jgi:hypothetical protein
MDPIISIPFSEAAIVQEFEKHFKKKDGFSILIPSSRQQKGFDLVIMNYKKRKSVLIQVKGSRTYIPKPPKRKSTKRYKNYTWFNAFKVEKGLSDYYVLFGIYVNISDGDAESTKIKNKNWYDYVILLFTEKEMDKIINSLTQKTTDKPDTSFSFGFDNIKNIMLTRGAKVPSDYTKYLLSKRIDIIKKKLK